MSTKRKYALLTLPMTAALTISCITPPALADSPGALPTFTLGGLPAGGFVTHNDFTLTIAPPGADDPVQRAEVFVDGAQVGHWGGVPPSVAFPLDDLPEGTHTVEVKAYDADDEEFVETRTFTVDTLVPDFSFTSHGLADGQTTDATHLSFTVYSEQGALTYQLDGGLWLAATDSQLLEFTDLAVGGHHLLLRSTDPAGNVIGGSFDWTVTAPRVASTRTRPPPEITGWVTKRTEGGRRPSTGLPGSRGTPMTTTRPGTRPWTAPRPPGRTGATRSTTTSPRVCTPGRCTAWTRPATSPCRSR